jgi:hypothetical protein
MRHPASRPCLKGETWGTRIWAENDYKIVTLAYVVHRRRLAGIHWGGLLCVAREVSGLGFV